MMAASYAPGEKFGRLQVIARAEGCGPHHETLWRCLCECGRETIIKSNKLRSGHVKSCGCLKRRSGLQHPNADTRPVLDRLAEQSHTVLATGCKIWTGMLKSSFGHGNISIAGKLVPVHRAAWEAERGPIPDGLDCLHNCPGGDNPACWNVDHLWLGTQGDNNADRDRKGRQIAPKGEQHGMARLTERDIIAIRADDRLNYLIAADYGVTGTTIGRIKRRTAWAHVTDHNQASAVAVMLTARHRLGVR
jgi:hypothetical protein